MATESRAYMENVIIDKLTTFVNDNPCIIFRYEFDERRKRFLVSYEVPATLEDDELLWDKLAEVKDLIVEAIPNRPPYFTQDNIVFTLSPDAAVIRSHSKEEGKDNQDFIVSPSEEYYFDENNDEQVFFGSYQVYSKAA